MILDYDCVMQMYLIFKHKNVKLSMFLKKNMFNEIGDLGVFFIKTC